MSTTARMMAMANEDMTALVSRVTTLPFIQEIVLHFVPGFHAPAASQGVAHHGPNSSLASLHATEARVTHADDDQVEGRQAREGNEDEDDAQAGAEHVGHIARGAFDAGHGPSLAKTR